jgi:hypothetical protein
MFIFCKKKHQITNSLFFYMLNYNFFYALFFEKEFVQMKR